MTPVAIWLPADRAVLHSSLSTPFGSNPVEAEATWLKRRPLALSQELAHGLPSRPPGGRIEVVRVRSAVLIGLPRLSVGSLRLKLWALVLGPAAG